MSDIFGQLQALEEYAPRAPNEERGDPGDPDYLRYAMLNEHAKVAYLSRRKAAADQDFQAGYAKATSLAGFDASRLPTEKASR